MELTIGQKVAYPNQGVCLVEEFSEHAFGSLTLSGYTLRVLHDNSTIFVPECNADNVGLRPLISSSECRMLMKMLAADFEPFAGDWKTRSREFSEKLRTGDIFQTAEVLKMLTFLSHMKKLSFREQSLLEKSKFLIVSVISNADPQGRTPAESEIVGLVESACTKRSNSSQAMAAIH